MPLVITFGIALLVFGPKKLPELGKGLGEGIRRLQVGNKKRRRDVRQSGSNRGTHSLKEESDSSAADR